jgi:hypothetical protein
MSNGHILTDYMTKDNVLCNHIISKPKCFGVKSESKSSANVHFVRTGKSLSHLGYMVGSAYNMVKTHIQFGTEHRYSEIKGSWVLLEETPF